MFRKRMICLLLCACCALIPVGTAAAREVSCDSTYCFQAADFSADDTLTGICITGLPDAETGTMMLGKRVLKCGDILTAEQLSQMTFVPLLTESDQDAQVTYLPIFENRVEAAATMVIAVRGKVDKAPIAEDCAIETYKNLPNESTLKVSDPEGQAMTFSIIRQSKRGTVSIREDGTFTYTPKKNKVGTDSFTYTATDPAGNVSREATVTIQILKPSEAAQYTDTVGHSCRFAAEWMKNTGLFIGEQVGGELCFQPEKTVSRGEFLSMLVNALNIPVDKDAAYTGFTDETPDWLKPYLAAALRSGITANWPDGQVFGAAQTVTGAEAALLANNALDLTVSASGEGSDDVPAWAADAMAAMADNGITLTAGEMTRGQAAELLYRISRLAAESPNPSY